MPVRVGPTLAIAALCLAPTLAHATASRPNPLAAQAGCDRYLGVPVGANDSTQQFELIVCPSATGVGATVQTSSLVSGWSSRASAGSWDTTGRVLTLGDTEFIESRPEPGWRFCLIDELVLERTDTGLTGSYVSHACDDRAELVLDKLESVEQPGSGVTPTPGSDSPPSVPDRGVRASGHASGACSCSTSEPSRSGGLLWLFVAVAIGLRVTSTRTTTRWRSRVAAGA